MTDSKSVRMTTAPRRQRAQVEPRLEQKLVAYAVVASAAGVALLAAPQAAEAKVVYTAVNTQITYPPFAIDLNGDGAIDFFLVNGGAASIAGSWQIQYLDVCHIGFSRCVSSSSMLQANADNVVRTGANGAAVLPFGANIGPGQQWGGKGQGVFMGGRLFYSQSQHPQKWEGPWAGGGKGETNKYLGLKFKIGNQFHYGWARVTFQVFSHGYQATITGYAYETIPGKAILAGATSGTAESAELRTPASSREVSLGMLALGSSGLQLWRKDEASN